MTKTVDNDNFLARMVERANINRPVINGSTDPFERMKTVKGIIANSEIVFGVWQDPSAPHGVGSQIIKGRRRLEAIAASGDAAPAGSSKLVPSQEVTWTAIPCACVEQAIAARVVLGDGGTF